MKRIYMIVALFCSVVSANAQTEDFFKEATRLSKYCAKFTLDEQPKILADTNLIAIWKVQEDEDKHNYFVIERSEPNEYVFTYMDRGGSNRTYENFHAFVSRVGNESYINVPIYDFETNTELYCFAKVTAMDKRGWHFTLNLVTDTTMKNIPNREALRKHIEKNQSNPGFFGKPTHFEKKLPLMYCK